MLENKSIEELNEIIKVQTKKARELRDLAAKENKIAIDANIELQKRNKWNSNVVINSMLAQLEENKSKISFDSYNNIKENLKDVNKTGMERMRSKNLRNYKQGQIISNIYIDLDRIIVHKLRQYKIIQKNFYYGNKAKYQLIFNFNNLESNISRKQSFNIFSTGKNKPFEFVVDEKEFVHVNKKVLSFLKTKYDSYNDIIPDLINVINFLEDELDSIFLAYNLSIEQ